MDVWNMFLVKELDSVLLFQDKEKENKMEKARILIVEDEVIIGMEIQDRLVQLGYTVVGLTSSGEDAIRKVERLHPDLVLMDIMLEGSTDGVKAAEIIRQKFRIPVVYLSAYSDNETLERAKLTEPFGYILKPFEERELRTTIEIALYKSKTEKEIQEKQHWFATTLKSIGDAVITTDLHSVVTFLNPMAEMLTGWKSEEALGKSIDSIFKAIDEVHRTPVECILKKVLNEKTTTARADHTLLISRDGKEFPIEERGALIQDENGRIFGAVLVFTDITMKKKLENQLRQSHKLEVVGTLAGGIAHDFNNLLTAIRGSVDMIMHHTPPDDLISQDLREIQLATERAADLIRQLLLFSRNQPMKFSVLSINLVIENMFKLLHRLIGENIGVSTSLDPKLWCVRGDQTALEQVIMNLTINARDAMPNGGKLFIKTENITLDEAYCQSVPEAHPGKFIRFSFTDTGLGMDRETVQRIFEPFFTTKGPGKGSGLGLSVVYGIIQQHGGWINVYSEPNQGTTFKIYLPAVKGKPARKSKKQISIQSLHGKNERILFIEDEKNVREFVSKALSQCGYQLFIAEDAKQAKEIFQKEKGNFDLVFTDVVLPDANGIQLVDYLLREKPKVRILLSSGYTDHKSQWPLIQERGYTFLQKPYTLTELLSVLRSVLRKKLRPDL